MAALNRSERDWYRWGEKYPFYGVLADAKFLNSDLTDDIRGEFFETGERHVEGVYSVIQSKIRPHFQAKRILDYGCGVGRLLVPFAKRAQTVVGMDISPGMLAQAQEHCGKHGADCVRLLDAHELDALTPSSFDLVHSFIVFQHIPVPEGERVLQKLLGLLAEGGVAAIHITFADVRSAVRRSVFAIRVRSRLMHGLFNSIQGKPFSLPLMQMNSYSMNRIFNILIDSHCSNLHVEFSDHGGFRGAMLYFEKNAERSQ